MSTIAIFTIFIVCMTASLVLGISMIIPLVIGFFLFTLKAYKMGISIKEIFNLIQPGVMDSMIVVRIILIIGCMTGIWRKCGTIPYFVVKGVNILPSSMFILTAFLLTAAMSFALGTSFGVTATCGTIVMAIARAGNVNTVIAAAAVLSGVYVGDRGSPAASSANLVAVVTHTDISENIKIMFRSAIAPFVITTALYFAISSYFPIDNIDMSLLNSLDEAFKLNPSCLVPAAVMVVLPFCKVPIIWCMITSIVSAMIIGMTVQGNGILEILRCMIFGYTSNDAFLNATLSGGGILSMIEVSVILIVSGTYGGLFKGTGMLDPVYDKLSSLSARIGRFPVMIILGVSLCGIFCNQTIGVIMQSQLSSNLYGESEQERKNKMLDIENSAIVLAGLVPWCIACSVPLAMMGADSHSVPLAFYLWLIPLCHVIHIRINDRKKALK